MSDKGKGTSQPGKSAGNRWGAGGKLGSSRLRRGRPSAPVLIGSSKQILLGPSIQGKPMKLVEVVSGEVIDRMPSFV